MSTSEIAKLESRWRENRQGLTFAPLAEAYRKMKEPQRALEILGEGLGLHPDYIPASIVLGRCHLDLADDAAAEAAFSRVLALDSENVIALKALAEITERHLRFDEAENWLRQLLVIDRSNDEARAQPTRVEDCRRNTVGVVRDEAGAAADGAEDDTGEMTAETSAEFAPTTPEPVPVEAEDTGHDFEPAESDFAPLADASRIAFDAADPAAAAEPEALELREVTHPDVATPVLDEFESPVDMSESLVPLQQADEFELRSSGASEFQSPDAAADLAALAEDAPFEDAPFEDAPFDEEAASDDLVLDEIAPEEPTAYEWTPMSAIRKSRPRARDGARGSIPPGPRLSRRARWSRSRSRSRSRNPQPRPRQSRSASRAEPEPFLTESMAELYLGQGHAHEALTIYRELYLRHPDDDRLRDKVTVLDAEAAADPGEPELPEYSAAPGGKSVAAMFRELLAARPAPAPAWSPISTPAPSTASLAEASPARVSEGEPTRPADDRLSLSAVFGDDSSPVPPAVPAGPVPGDGLSFDAFFDAAPPSEPAPRRAAARDDDDLDQFHAWLQNLKR